MKSLFDGLVQAGREIRSNLFRSILTILGVVLGVAALVAMQGVIESMIVGMQAFNETKGGLTKISVVPEALPVEQQHLKDFSPGRTLRDAEALRRNATLVHNISPEVDLSWTPLVHGDRTDWGLVLGVTPAYLQIYNLEVQQGRFISELDSGQFSQVCVLGSELMLQIFQPGEPVVGQHVKIGTHAFTVIGVMPRYVSRQSGRNALWRRNWSVWIPVATAQKRFTASPKIDQLDMQVIGLANMAPAMEEVENILRPIHRWVRDFRPDNQLSAMLDFGRQQQRLRASLGGVAGLSLLIGGIGIMSVMLAGVNDRVREIGVRKALGAQRADIFLQFLFESTVLSLVGGAGGIAAGIGLVRALAHFLPEQPPLLVPSALVLGAVASALTGVLAGIYPALRAAALDPIEALRYE